MVEITVILVGQFTRFFRPCGFGYVHNVRTVRIDIFAVFPFFLKSGNNGHGEEAAIFLEKKIDFVLLEEFLVYVIDIQHDICSAIGFLRFLHCEFGRTVTAPFYSLGSLFIG